MQESMQARVQNNASKGRNLCTLFIPTVYIVFCTLNIFDFSALWPATQKDDLTFFTNDFSNFTDFVGIRITISLPCFRLILCLIIY